MQIEFSMAIQDYAVLFPTAVSMTILESQSIEFGVEVDMYVNSSSDYVRANLPPYMCVMREASGPYGAVSATLPALTAEIEGGFYVPPAVSYVFAVLPPLTASVLAGSSSPISIDADLPIFQGQAFESNYGAVSATLPALQSIAYEDPNPGEAWCVSVVYGLDGAIALTDFLVVINSEGQIVDTLSASRLTLASILESLNAQSTMSVLGYYAVTSLARAAATTQSTAAVRATVAGEPVYKPVIDTGSRVWVVNMDTSQSSQYEDYGFNSFFERDGEYFGVADDGVYLLDGDTDAGLPIATYVDFGKSDCGVQGVKKIPNVHVGTSDGSDMYLRVTTDSGTATYRLEQCFRGPAGWRARVPQTDMQGWNWRWELIASNAFELHGVEFAPVKLNKRM